MNARQLRFVQEYLIDPNATQAAIRAGYNAKNADVTGPRLLGNVGIKLAITKAQESRAEHVGLSQEYVIERLMSNVERAMQAEPVFDKEGNPTGEYTYQGSVANGALQLLGKHLGMFVDRTEDVTNLTRDERKERLLKLMA